ncbi:MAG: transposase [Thermaerobacter sp.]|nr:transposase [Thermaerobacter sp.]
MKITLGIDLAQKGLHHVAIRWADGTTDPTVRNLGWDSTAWEQMAQDLEARCPNATVQVMMEPTGTAWVTVGQWMARRGWEVYLVKSLMVSDLRKFFQHHVKNDRVDAWTLAQLPWLHPTAPMRVTFDRPEIQALVRWTKRQHQLGRQIAKLSQAIQAKAEACIPGISALFPNLATRSAEHVYTQALNPFETAQRGRDALIAALHAAGDTFAKRSMEDVATRLWGLLERATALYGNADELDWAARIAEIQADWEILTLLRRQHAEAVKAARHAYEQVDPDRTLESIYGVGRQGAPAFTAALASHNFSTAKKFRGYTGLIPRVNESGVTTSRNQRATKAGPRWLKAQLYLAAETARRFDPQLAALYYRERVDKGHVHTQAVVTVATHLADRIWKVYQTGRRYELRGLDGQPIDASQARALIQQHWTVPDRIRQRTKKGAARTRQGRPEGPQMPTATPSPTLASG